MTKQELIEDTTELLKMLRYNDIRQIHSEIKRDIDVAIKEAMANRK